MSYEIDDDLFGISANNQNKLNTNVYGSCKEFLEDTEL